MLKYILTSEKFTGSVVFGYSDTGWIVFLHNEAEMNAVQQEWLINNLPLTAASIKAFAAKINGKLEEIPEDLDFERFWEKYGKKINRKRCEPLYKKLKDAEKLQVLKSIEPYKAYLRRTGYRSQVDPENYLKKGMYENNWNREI